MEVELEVAVQEVERAIRLGEPEKMRTKADRVVTTLMVLLAMSLNRRILAARGRGTTDIHLSKFKSLNRKIIFGKQYISLISLFSSLLSKSNIVNSKKFLGVVCLRNAPIQTRSKGWN